MNERNIADIKRTLAGSLADRISRIYTLMARAEQDLIDEGVTPEAAREIVEKIYAEANNYVIK